ATKRLKHIAKDERIAEEDSSHGSHDGKRRKKNFEEEHSPSSGKANKKKKKARDELTELGETKLSNVSDTGLGTGNKPTVTIEETAGNDNCRMQSSSVSGDEKKTRKKKKTKDGRDNGMNISAEGNSSTEITDKNKRTRNARKRSKVSADEITSSVGNLDVSHTSTTAETKKKVKKVKFSGHVEVFPTTDDAKSNDQANEIRLVQGKRFSKEEDEMIKQAVFDYIEEMHLGEDGLNMVLKCRSHRQIKDCWKEIGAALPWRRSQSIYWRAHTLFQRSEIRKWEPEELDLVRRYYKEHGPKWKEMAELLGKHRVHVKDTWRRIKLTNRKTGNWSQEEYQALFDLVNVDLQLKAFEEKKTKHGMLRENISWGAISRKLDTRHEASCCMKWYKQLTSPMVTQGLWADTDDYRLIDALLKLDASCMEDVEWDSLLEHRSGEICLRRWKQMVRHIGGHRERSFMEQAELLATRYCPNMLEFRARSTQNCGGRDHGDDLEAE
ncbi:hypothetical protein Taro_028073, partial [Colocasia esculenta]|nr:hypothetical protein [Colocasia esculenta]